jgi:RNA-binding protein YlmH
MKTNDLLHKSIVRNIAQFSDFMPNEHALAIQKSSNKQAASQVDVAAYGGYDNAERVILGFFPNNLEQRFPISRIKASVESKFSKLGHRDFLGAIMGLGIAREKIGDIVPIVDDAIIFCMDNIADFLCENLTMAGRSSIQMRILNPADDDYEFFGLNSQTQIVLSVASLRLDAVVAAAFGIERDKASGMIKSGRAFVNSIQISSHTKKCCCW